MPRLPLLLLAALIAATPAAAQQIDTQPLIQADAASLTALAQDADTVTFADAPLPEEVTKARFVQIGAVAVPKGIAHYGPFRVLDKGRAALVDVTDSTSPTQFLTMLRNYPGIRTLELIECPGTDDDRANLRLGRLIRSRGIATHVPAQGSVRSGGVELFLAGIRHTAANGAEFAVHAWADDQGHEPGDFSLNALENKAYLDYYRDMGMTGDQAIRFYAMTNSVPNASAKWLSVAEMGQWVAVE